MYLTWQYWILDEPVGSVGVVVIYADPNSRVIKQADGTQRFANFKIKTFTKKAFWQNELLPNLYQKNAFGYAYDWADAARLLEVSTPEELGLARTPPAAEPNEPAVESYYVYLTKLARGYRYHDTPACYRIGDSIPIQIDFFAAVLSDPNFLSNHPPCSSCCN